MVNKVSRRIWKRAMDALNARPRSNDAEKNPGKTYLEWIERCGYGSSILDVGCGYQWLKDQLPEGVTYIGIDPFPVVEGTIKGAIEDTFIEADTVICFAVLDGCYDFHKACENLIRSARKNIIIVTGIGFEVDRFHTFRLEWSDFDKAFKNLSLTHKEELRPNVYLINYEL